MTAPAVFVINLADSTDRLAAMNGRLTGMGLAYRVYAGVDGRKMSDEEKRTAYPGPPPFSVGQGWFFPLCDGEIGCALSQIGVYRRIVAEGLPCALVLEDDMELSPAVPDVLEALAERFSPDEPAVVLLTQAYSFYPRTREPLREGVDIVRVYEAALAGGYFITRRAAALLAEKLYPVWTVADDWWRFRDIVSLHCLDPALIRPDGKLSNVSTIAVDPCGDPDLFWAARRRAIFRHPLVAAGRLVARAGRWVYARWHGIRPMPDARLAWDRSKI